MHTDHHIHTKTGKITDSEGFKVTDGWIYLDSIVFVGFVMS